MPHTSRACSWPMRVSGPETTAAGFGPAACGHLGRCAPLSTSTFDPEVRSGAGAQVECQGWLVTWSDGLAIHPTHTADETPTQAIGQARCADQRSTCLGAAGADDPAPGERAVAGDGRTSNGRVRSLREQMAGALVGHARRAGTGGCG